MATQLQIRRGTATQVAAFTGAEGEIVVNTTNDSVHVNDGSTAGGFELARIDGSNWAITNDITTTANISFGDNDKAIFGAGSDLQIYHSGSESRIDENGAGNLKINADNLEIYNSASSEAKAKFNTNGSVQLYYDNAEKLATTSTGIDVTGTVTSDGLTVGATSAPTISIEDSDGGFTASSFSATNGGRDLTIKAPQEVVIQDADTGNKWLRIDEGDISFYEDTGTTPKLTWSASAENLSIVGQKDSTVLTLSAPMNTVGGGSLANYNEILFDNSYVSGSSGQAYLRHLANSHGDNGSALAFGVTTTGGTTNEALRIDSSGIDVTGTVTADGLTVDSTTGFSWLPVSTAGAKVGAIGTGTGLIINTPSVNASYGSGLAIDGSYAGDLSSVNVKAFGPKFSSYGSELNLFTSDDTSLLKRQTIASNGDISFYEDTGTTAKLTWDASAESLNFADNGKAIFGAGSDLQIYHTGSQSIIRDAGTGDLQLLADASISLKNSAGTTTKAEFISGGAVNLYNNNALKLATTSSGIDVTGSVTADGLTSAGNVLVSQSGANSAITINRTDESPQFNLTMGQSGSSPYITGNDAQDFHINVDPDNTQGSSAFNLNIDGNIALKANAGGDISFYEDTGTTPKFFWDASAESLGIGTSSPLYNLDLFGSSAVSMIRTNDTTSPTLGLFVNSGTNGVGTISVDNGGHMTFDTGSNGAGQLERMRIDSSGLTVKGGAVFNEDSADVDFRVESNNQAHMLFIDGGNDRLLIGKTTADSGVVGTQFRPDGLIAVTRDGDVSGIFNRKTSDGSIVEFRKNNNAVGSISVTSSATAYNTSSDQRLKDNIVDAEDAGELIDAIQVRQFDWKADGSHQRFGMVAQELTTVAPEAVSTPEDPDEMMGVDYSKLVPMLIKEIQTLRSRVAQLENN